MLNAHLRRQLLKSLGRLVNNGCLIHQREIKAQRLLWIRDDSYADAPLVHVTHEQQRNTQGVDGKKVLGWGEKGAMAITQTDKSGGGVSPWIRREEGEMRQKGFNYPIRLQRSKHNNGLDQCMPRQIYKCITVWGYANTSHVGIMRKTNVTKQIGPKEWEM